MMISAEPFLSIHDKTYHKDHAQTSAYTVSIESSKHYL